MVVVIVGLVFIYGPARPKRRVLKSMHQSSKWVGVGEGEPPGRSHLPPLLEALLEIRAKWLNYIIRVGYKLSHQLLLKGALSLRVSFTLWRLRALEILSFVIRRFTLQATNALRDSKLLNDSKPIAIFLLLLLYVIIMIVLQPRLYSVYLEIDPSITHRLPQYCWHRYYRIRHK